MIKLSAPKNNIISGILDIPSSKSLSNRVLIIQALCKEAISLQNVSIADDTTCLKKALEDVQKISTSPKTIDVGLAGTAFRFLCAYLAVQKGEFILTGAKRIQERPIKPLIDALISLGADIEYIEKEGFAPLLIKGKKLNANTIQIDADISSQFITALLLIAPSFGEGFTLQLNKKISSKPYIDMTLSLMNHFGIKTSFEENIIKVFKGNYKSNALFIEADWSTASYFYACLALAKDGEIVLKNYNKISIQGDAKLAELFVPFGVQTRFEEKQIKLTKTIKEIDSFEYNFSNEPDLAQTFISLCVGLGIEAKATGLESLKIKETNRISALNSELNKLNWSLTKIKNSKAYVLQKEKQQTENELIFDTYKDHRMAMCLAPLCLVFGSVYIRNEAVVSKSNPLFWEQLNQLGFRIEKID